MSLFLFSFLMTRDDKLRKDAERQQVKRAKRKSEGLCIQCGGAPPDEGKAKCRTCLDSHCERQKTIYAENKLAAVKYLGGKCLDCGIESSHTEIYDFHHRDPDTKETNVAWMLWNKWELLVVELDKCDLICANCHRIRTRCQP